MTRVACHSEDGLRPNQQDAGAAYIINTTTPVRRDGAALWVFDAVGGNAGGQVASTIALREAAPRVHAALAAALLPERESPVPGEFLKEAMQDALSSANDAILERIEQEPALRGMATTAVCALIVDGILVVACLGFAALCQMG